MIVRYLDIVSIVIAPLEADPILIVDTNAMLTLAILAPPAGCPEMRRDQPAYWRHRSSGASAALAGRQARTVATWATVRRRQPLMQRKQLQAHYWSGTDMIESLLSSFFRFGHPQTSFPSTPVRDARPLFESTPAGSRTYVWCLHVGKGFPCHVRPDNSPTTTDP